MKKGPSEQSFAGLLKPLPVQVLGAHRHNVCAGDVFPKVRQAQAPFAANLLSLFADDLRVDQYQFGAGIFLKGNVNHHHALADADLGRCQPHAVGMIHALKHVVRKLA